MAVIKLHDVKAAAVYIEMDITLFKIGRNSLPDRDLRMHSFDLAPRCVSYAFAVNGRGYEQQFQLTVIILRSDHNTADRLIVLHDPESCPFVDRTGDRIT
jgi:hypothetical protein